MAARRLYRYKVTVLEAKSGSESDRVPVSAATLVALWPGPRANGSSTVPDAGAGGIVVNDSAGARAGDLVYQNNLGATQRQLHSTVGTGVATQTALVVIAGAGAVNWADGDQVVLSRTPNPAMYTDIDGQESVASVSTNSNGEATFYCKSPVIDLDINDASVHSTSFGLEGEAGGEEFWPEEFGAVRQGTGHASPTDDYAAFQALALFLSHRGGGKIRLGVGTYRLNTSWQLSGISNLVIEGAGPGLTILEINHANVGVDITGSATDIQFKNLTLRRVGSASTAALLSVGASITRCIIDTVLFNASGVNGGIAVLDSGTDTRIDRAWATGSGGWVTGYRAVAASRPRVSSFIIRPEANWTYGFDIDTDTIGARFRDCEIVPLSTQTGTGVTVRQQAAGTNAPRDIIFDGCVFRAGTSNTGIDIRGCRGVTIDNCTIRDSQIGVAVLGGYAVRISDCNIHTIQNEGIRINDTVGTVNGVVITEPIFEGVNVSAGGYGHIVVAGTCAYIFVNGMSIGNWLTGAATAVEYAINVSGAGVTEVQILGVRGDDAQINSGWINNSMTAESVDISHSRFGAGGRISYIHSTPLAGGTAATSAGIKVLTASELTVDVQNIHTIIFNNAGGSITWSNFTNPTDGQEITCINVHATNDVTFTSGANYKVDAGSVVLDQYQGAIFKYYATTGLWYMLGKSENA